MLPFELDQHVIDHVRYHCVVHFEGLVNYEILTIEAVMMDSIQLNLKLKAPMLFQPDLFK